MGFFSACLKEPLKYFQSAAAAAEMFALGHLQTVDFPNPVYSYTEKTHTTPRSFSPHHHPVLSSELLQAPVHAQGLARTVYRFMVLFLDGVQEVQYEGGYIAANAPFLFEFLLYFRPISHPLCHFSLESPIIYKTQIPF